MDMYAALKQLQAEQEETKRAIADLAAEISRFEFLLAEQGQAKTAKPSEVPTASTAGLPAGGDSVGIEFTSPLREAVELVDPPEERQPFTPFDLEEELRLGAVVENMES